MVFSMKAVFDVWWSWSC